MAISPDFLKQRWPLILAVVTGVLAFLLIHRYLSVERHKLALERQKLAADYQAPVEIVVAPRDIPEGTKLSEDHLALGMIPEKFVQPYATSNPADVIGQVTLAPIAEGEQVLRNKLRHPSEVPLGEALSAIMPEGKRAVTIAVDLVSGVGGFVRPGDAVDVLWTIKLAEQQGGEPVTMTLFQGVPVLAIGQRMAGEASSESEEEERPHPESGYLVTLALTPQETAVLLFAREQGRVQLSLRSQADRDRKVAVVPANSQVLMETVLGKEAVTARQERVSPQRTVEVYKGLERSVVSVNE